jgi:hypothetical protein
MSLAKFTGAFLSLSATLLVVFSVSGQTFKAGIALGFGRQPRPAQ